MTISLHDLTYHRFSGDNLKLSWDEYYVKYWKELDRDTTKDILGTFKVDIFHILSNYTEFKYDLELAYKHTKELSSTRVLMEFMKQYPFNDTELINLLDLPQDCRYYHGLNENENINLDLFLTRFQISIHQHSLMRNPKLTEDLILRHWDTIMKGEFTERLYLTSYNFSLEFLREHLTKFTLSDTIECICKNNTVSEEVTQFFKIVEELER